MQVTVDVTDEIRREAESRGLPVIDFVEMLVQEGLNRVLVRPVVDTAIERIRALRSAAPIPRR
jgi:ACT domain-containing protein